MRIERHLFFRGNPLTGYRDEVQNETKNGESGKSEKLKSRSILITQENKGGRGGARSSKQRIWKAALDLGKKVGRLRG